MKALQLDGTSLTLRDVAVPEPGPGEALVRVLMAGVCNTDVEIARGYMGFEGTLGHELVGVVERAPEPELVGQRVSSEINLACGQCAACGRGLGRHCPHRTVLGILGKDGCFAEYVTVPTANLQPVPEGLSDEAASFVEPIAAAYEVPQLVHVDPDDRVLVLGDGKLGLAIAMVLRYTGCALTVVGRHERKLAIARQLGLQVATPENPTEHGFDVVVEATGSPQGLEYALERVRPRGTLVLKSTYHGRPEVATAKVVVDEIRVVGSRCGPFPPAVRSLADARIDPTPLVDEVHPLSEGVTAFERAQARGMLKVLLDMRG